MINKNNILQQTLIREVGFVLNESDIQPDDNFIELGGTSFLAIQVMINLKEKMKLEIDISELLSARLGNINIKPLEMPVERSS